MHQWVLFLAEVGLGSGVLLYPAGWALPDGKLPTPLTAFLLLPSGGQVDAQHIYGYTVETKSFVNIKYVNKKSITHHGAYYK